MRRTLSKRSPRWSSQMSRQPVLAAEHPETGVGIRAQHRPTRRQRNHRQRQRQPNQLAWWTNRVTEITDTLNRDFVNPRQPGRVVWGPGDRYSAAAARRDRPCARGLRGIPVAVHVLLLSRCSPSPRRWAGSRGWPRLEDPTTRRGGGSGADSRSRARPAKRSQLSFEPCPGACPGAGSGPAPAPTPAAVSAAGATPPAVGPGGFGFPDSVGPPRAWVRP